MVLTEKQRSDLHKAVLTYLEHSSFSQTSTNFRQEAGLSAEPPAAPGTTPLLEKKWTSVVRLQRKVLSLESEIERLKAEAAQRGKGGLAHANGTSGSSTSGSFLPSQPARHQLSGHRAPVTSAVFHPVFNLLVSTSEDATAKVWDYETGEFERTLKGHTNTVQHASFRADGKVLATCSSDLSIKLWDFTTSYDCTKTLMGHDHNVTCVAFLHGSNANVLVSCSRDKTLRVWDITTGYCTRTLSGHGEWVRKLAVSPGVEDVIASCSSDQTIMVWNATSGSQLGEMRGHEHVVESIAFSSGPADSALVRRSKVAALAVTPGGAAAAAAKRAGGESGSAKRSPVKLRAFIYADVRSVHSATHTSISELHKIPYKCLIHAYKRQCVDRAGGAHLISGSRDRTVRVWSVATCACLLVLKGHDSWVRAVAFEPMGKYAVTASEDKSIKLWDLGEERCVRTIAAAHAHFVTALALHPGGAPFVATGSVDMSLKIWR